MARAQQTGNFLINLLKGLGRQAIGKPIGVGQKFAGQLAGVSPEELEKRREISIKKGGFEGLLARLSKAGSLTKEEREDPFIIPKAFAGQAAFTVPGGQASLVGKTAVGAGAGALSGFGVSKPGEELASTVGGGALGGVLGAGTGILGKFAKRIKTGRLTKAAKPPTITGKKLPSTPSFVSTKTKLSSTAKDIGIRDTMRANDKLQLVENGLKSSQDEIATLLKGSKPIKQDVVLDNFVKHFNNTALDETKPGVKRLINNILKEIEEASGDNIALNQLKTKARKEMGNVFSKDTAGTDRQEAWGSLFSGIKDSLDNVSKDIRKINNTQKTLFDLADEFVPQARKATETIGVKIPFTDATVPTPITQEGFQLGVQKAGRAITAPARAGGRVVEGLGALDNLPQPIKNAIIAQITGGDAQQAVAPEVSPQAPLEGQVDATQLDPERQRAMDIIDQAEAQAGGQAGGGQITPEMASLAQLLLSPADAKKFKTAFDIQQASQKTDKVKLSGTERKNIRLAESSLRALDEIEVILKDDPNVFLKAALPGAPGARKYESAVIRAVEGLLRSRSGAAVPETEVQRYIVANLPIVGDAPETVTFKLSAFRKDLVAEANPVPSGQPDITQILQSLQAGGLAL